MFKITNNQGNANQNHNEISPHTCHDGYYQKTKDKCWQEYGEIGTLAHSSYTGRNVKWCGHYGKQYGRSSKF